MNKVANFFIKNYLLCRPLKLQSEIIPWRSPQKRLFNGSSQEFMPQKTARSMTNTLITCFTRRQAALFYLCCSGMRLMYRRGRHTFRYRFPFRPADNSLFNRHLTHICLLCFYVFICNIYILYTLFVNMQVFFLGQSPDRPKK